MVGGDYHNIIHMYMYMCNIVVGTCVCAGHL